MTKLLSILDDGTGSLSSMRVALLIWTVGPFVVWAWTSYQAKAPQPIPESVLLAMGAVLSGKCLQNVSERPADKQPSPPPAS